MDPSWTARQPRVRGRRGGGTGVVALLVVALTSGFLGGAVVPSPSAGSSAPTASSADRPRRERHPGLDRRRARADAIRGTCAGRGGDRRVDVPRWRLAQRLEGRMRAAGGPVRGASTARRGPLRRGAGAAGFPADRRSRPRVSGRLERAYSLDGLPRRHQPSRAAAERSAGGPIDARPGRRPAPAHPRSVSSQLRLPAHSVRSGRRGRIPSSGRATVGPSPAATASPSGAAYADGIPSTFDGQPVLRPTQAAAQAAASTDASTFLIGGWVGAVPIRLHGLCARRAGRRVTRCWTRAYCGVYLAESPTGDRRGPAQAPFPCVGLADDAILGPGDRAGPHARPTRHLLCGRKP